MTKDGKDEDDGWREFKPKEFISGKEGQLVLVDGAHFKRFGSYWELLDDVIHRTFDICVNSPEEYEALELAEREKLDAVHNAWMS